MYTVNIPKPSLRSLYAVLLVFMLCTIVFYFMITISSMDTVSDSNNIIEKALEQLPTCTTFDRFRQRTLLTMLYAWSQFAEQHHIQYWIAYGSLVGYIQRRGLLPHDLDVDILMLAQDTRHLLPFADINFSPIYELKVHPQWDIVGETKRIYYRSQGIDFIAPNARFIHRQYRYHVDIWPIYDYRPDQPRNTTHTIKTLTEYSRSYSWISSPITWTFPLQRCLFNGIQVWCPAMPERLISIMYGRDALNKSDTKCINGKWV